MLEWLVMQHYMKIGDRYTIDPALLIGLITSSSFPISPYPKSTFLSLGFPQQPPYQSLPCRFWASPVIPLHITANLQGLLGHAADLSEF